MAPKAAKAVRKLRGAQKWIHAELTKLGSGARLATADIAKAIPKASGKTFHKNSIYNALRVMVKRGILGVKRQGREKYYYLASVTRAAVGRPRGSSGSPASAAPSTGSVSVAPASSGATAAAPHKLALGEILIIRVAAGKVVTATNLHGKIVIEQHPLPS